MLPRHKKKKNNRREIDAWIAKRIPLHTRSKSCILRAINIYTHGASCGGDSLHQKIQSSREYA